MPGMLLADPEIARNPVKIGSAEIARRVQGIGRSHSSFARWIDRHYPHPVEDWTKLFCGTFHFIGGQIVNEFLVSLDYLSGAMESDCRVYERSVAQSPPGARVGGV